MFTDGKYLFVYVFSTNVFDVCHWMSWSVFILNEFEHMFTEVESENYKMILLPVCSSSWGPGKGNHATQGFRQASANRWLP